MLAPYAQAAAPAARARPCRCAPAPPVDLDDLLRPRRSTAEVLREATARIMAAITALLEVLRGEKAPVVRFDPRTHGVTPDRQSPAPWRRPHDERSGLRHRHLGHGVRRRCSPTPARDVTMWGRRQEVVDQINDGRQPRLPARAARCPSTIRATTDPAEAADGRRHRRARRARRRRCAPTSTAWGSALPPRRRSCR